MKESRGFSPHYGGPRSSGDQDPIAAEVGLEQDFMESQARSRVTGAVSGSGDAVPEEASPSITVRDLSFEYVQGTAVLKDISIEIPPGSVVVLAGKSGCGKSTLIKILAGLYRPSPGTVFIGIRTAL